MRSRRSAATGNRTPGSGPEPRAARGGRDVELRLRDGQRRAGLLVLAPEAQEDWPVLTLPLAEAVGIG